MVDEDGYREVIRARRTEGGQASRREFIKVLKHRRVDGTQLFVGCPVKFYRKVLSVTPRSKMNKVRAKGYSRLGEQGRNYRKAAFVSRLREIEAEGSRERIRGRHPRNPNLNGFLTCSLFII